MPLQLLASPAISLLSTFVLLCWILRQDHHWLPMDQPNARSLHARPTPRAGGIGITVGLTAGTMMTLPDALSWLLPVLLLAGISLMDDWRGLPVSIRFAMHSAAAAGFVAWVLPDLPPSAFLGLVLTVVWMTNLYNFMDGSDGLAGGMALFGFSFYGLVAWRGEDPAMAAGAFGVAAAALVFLFFNFHPARIFMGDAGSVPLGFLAAALGLLGWQHGHWPLWFPGLVFSPFIMDATVTLTRRLLRGEKIWQAHREHYYQRLVRMGYGQRMTALLEYALMALVGSTAVWAIDKNDTLRLVLVLGWAVIYLALMLVVEVKWKAFLQGRTSGETA